jgi:hypothetical protein
MEPTYAKFKSNKHNTSELHQIHFMPNKNAQKAGLSIWFEILV